MERTVTDLGDLSFGSVMCPQCLSQQAAFYSYSGVSRVDEYDAKTDRRTYTCESCGQTWTEIVR